MTKTKRIALIEECIELTSLIEQGKEDILEYKPKIKALMIKSLDYNKEILGYGTKSYFNQAINLWRMDDTIGNRWLIPCITDVKYSLMLISERPMIHAVDDLIEDLTYDQLLCEVNRLK